MVGNSSSGIIESASFKLPAVNVGDRQKGRVKPENVIDCDCSKDAVLAAVRRALSPQFQRSLAGLRNPYGEGNSAERIVRILKALDWSDRSKWLKKGFYDIPWVSSSLPKLESITTAI